MAEPRPKKRRQRCSPNPWPEADPDNLEEMWTLLIAASDRLLEYPDCIAGIMPYHDPGLDRFLALADKVEESNKLEWPEK